MDFVDLKNKTTAELEKILAERREEWRELRFKAHGRELKQANKLREARKIIAQVSTLLAGTASLRSASAGKKESR